jgi:hypothetical protein
MYHDYYTSGFSAGYLSLHIIFGPCGFIENLGENKEFMKMHVINLIAQRKADRPNSEFMTSGSYMWTQLQEEHQRSQGVTLYHGYRGIRKSLG